MPRGANRSRHNTELLIEQRKSCIGSSEYWLTGPGTLWIDNCRIFRFDRPEDAEKPYVPNPVVLNGLLAAQPSEGPKGAHRIWFLTRDATMKSILSWHAGSRVNIDWRTSVEGTMDMTLPMGLEFDLATGRDAASRMRPWLVMQHLVHSEEDWLGLVEYLAAPYDPASHHEYDMAAYEGGPGGYALPGSAPPEQVEVNERYGKSLAMAVGCLDAWMRSYQYGWTDQCFLGYGKLDGNHDGHDFGDGHTPVTLRLPFAAAEKITLYKMTGDPRLTNREKLNIRVRSQDVPVAAIRDGRFAVNDQTGAGPNGLPPGSIFLYVFQAVESRQPPP